MLFLLFHKPWNIQDIITMNICENERWSLTLIEVTCSHFLEVSIRNQLTMYIPRNKVAIYP